MDSSKEKNEVVYSLCDNYVQLSSNIRRHFTLMESYFGFAQVAFEDVLCGRGTPHTVEHHLRNSRTNALQVITIADTLESKMDAFRNLLALSTIDMDALGQGLISKGIVNVRAWKQVTKNARLGGFHKNLLLIRSMATLAIERMNSLSKKMQYLREGKEDITIEQLGNMNLPGSPEVIFAQLRSLLLDFQNIFNAAWILSMEIYHHFHSHVSSIDGYDIAKSVKAG